MKKIASKLLVILLVLNASLLTAQELPSPSVVGYWQNWQNQWNPFIEISEVDERYNVICVAFAEGQLGQDYNMTYSLFGSTGYTDSAFKADIQERQANGGKVLLSLGGQNGSVLLDSVYEKDVFVSSLNALIDQYGFDGIDIDLEGESLHFDTISVHNPTDVRLSLLIEGIQEVIANHQATHGERLLLTMAPETYYVQGGLSTWGDYGGAYLPIIEALRDEIDMINVQLYNSGNMFGLDGNTYTQPSADFIVAMTEAVILGFTTADSTGTYSGLPASKVGVGLPSICNGWDYTPVEETEAAIKYLLGQGPQANRYTLMTEGGYPDLRGMMTWSINADRRCGPGYHYVRNYEILFTGQPYLGVYTLEDITEGEEDGKVIVAEIHNDTLVETLNMDNWEVRFLPAGVEVGSVERINDSIAHIVLSGSVDYGSYTGDITNIRVHVQPEELEIEDMESYAYGITFLKTIVSAPGKVEAEDFTDTSGAIQGIAGDAGGGYKLEFREAGDEATYRMVVATTGTYVVDVRVSSRYGGGILGAKLDGVSVLTDEEVPMTNSWTSWQTVQYTMSLEEGVHDFVILAEAGGFDVNWMDFVVATGFWENGVMVPVHIYPNPVNDFINFEGAENASVEIVGHTGKVVLIAELKENEAQLGVTSLKPGVYIIQLSFENGSVGYAKFIKE